MYIMTKSGIITTNLTSDNQCKVSGCKEYGWTIILKTDTQLDDNGFVINHIVFDSVVKKVFLSRMDSCEIMAYDIHTRLSNLLIYHNIKRFKLSIKIHPIDAKAYIIYKKNYKWKA